MGCFSWMDCMALSTPSSKTNIVIGGNQQFNVLLPHGITEQILEKFPYTKLYFNEKQNSLRDSQYDGYGRMGGVDVYELIAFMNLRCTNKETVEEIINKVVEVPKREQYEHHFYDFQIEDYKKQGKTDDEIHAMENAETDKWYELAVGRYEHTVKAIREYAQTGKGKTDDVRDLGIALGCGQKRSAMIPYPLKVTYDKSISYEECLYSPDDPNQGCSWLSKRDAEEEINMRTHLLAQNNSIPIPNLEKDEEELDR